MKKVYVFKDVPVKAGANTNLIVGGILFIWIAAILTVSATKNRNAASSNVW